jgi:hypothetical protein
MRVTQVDAIQVHYIPSRPYAARDIDELLPRELFTTEITEEYESADDEGGSHLAPGATAQNNYNPIKFYRCRHCNGRVGEDELDLHVCED